MESDNNINRTAVRSEDNDFALIFQQRAKLRKATVQ